MTGLFITFEGPEGSGKSTHAAGLARRLRERGLDVVETREPGGTPTGEAIRRVLQHDAAGEPISPVAEVLLFAASRAQLVSRVILPALERGAVVVCDRFADSTTAYQGYGRGLDIDMIVGLNALAIGNAVPDMTILLDLEVKTGFERLTRRMHSQQVSHDRFEREEMSFHERVRAGYIEMAARSPERFRIVDSRGDVETVDAAVWRIVDKELLGRRPRASS
jgi:dTMP kinase